MHNESAMFREGFSTPMTTPVRENTALSNLREHLAWYERQLDEGVSDIEQRMTAMKKKIDENSEIGRKISDIRNAIALIERNI